MSARINNVADQIGRQPNVPGVNPLSTTLWVQLVNDRNTDGIIFIIGDTGSGYQAVEIQNNGTTLEIQTSAGTSSAGTNLSVGVWYFLAYTRTGSSHALWLATETTEVSQIISFTSSPTISSPNYMVIGNVSSQWVDARFSRWREWGGTIISEAEMNAERLASSAARSTSIYGDWPLASDLNDDSINGNNLVSAGTIDFEADPSPVAVPSGNPWYAYAQQ